MLHRGGNKADGKAGHGEAARRHPRHCGKNKVRCPLGDVLDLSAGGMRVFCAAKPPFKAGTAAKINLRTNAGDEPVNVRCCWVRKTGLLKGYELGFKFIGITQEQSARLGKIAQFGFLPRDEQRPAGGKPNGKSAAGPPVTAELDLAPYYRTLELEQGADAQDVRHAYRRLVRTCHPDVNNAPDAQHQFLALQEAYDILRSHTRNDHGKAA